MAKSDLKLENLNLWNKVLAVVFAIQGLAILVFSTATSFPVNNSYVGQDTLATQASGHKVLAIGTHHLFDVRLAFVVALFLLVAAAAHALAATKFRSYYEQNIRKGVNQIRWIEYTLTSGLMLIAISLLSGVYDVAALVLIFSLAAVSNLIILLETRSRASCILSSVTGLIPWLAIAAYLKGSIFYGDSNVPGFVLWIFVTLFLCYLASLAIRYLHSTKKGSWADYAYNERVFMILSLVAKTALAWQIFAGSLRP